MLDRVRPNRRSFLLFGASAATALFAKPALAKPPLPSVRCIAFNNVRTGETLNTAYWENGRYISEALDLVDKVLRDHHTDEVHEIDVRLLDLLHALCNRLELEEPLQVMSGYRSPETNARLARHNSRVASQSYHMKGMAVDIRVPDRRLRDVRRAAVEFAVGGVGYYPRSNFVHLDVGPFRTW